MTPLFLTVSDLHFSHRAPRARAVSDEQTWYDQMAQHIMELTDLQADLMTQHDLAELPILVAGDICHTWNEPPELINFLISQLPRGMYTIPGQHDLKHHNLEDIRKTAYWTLVAAGAVEHIPACGMLMGAFAVEGFAWGQPLKPATFDFGPRVAVIHKYVWHEKKSAYPGAEAAANIRKVLESLAHFDMVIFGDNHIPFQGTSKGTWFINNGAFMQRKRDEEAYGPRANIVSRDDAGKLHVKPFFFSTDWIRWASEDQTGASIDKDEIVDFVMHLGSVMHVAMDFSESIRRVIDAHPALNRETVTILLEALDQ
jgi:hypothetical protein